MVVRIRRSEDCNGLLYNQVMHGKLKPPRHLVWSTDEIDLDDPFQRRWYLQQVLTHGMAEDIRSLDKDEVAREIDYLHLPVDIESLWRMFLVAREG